MSGLFPKSSVFQVFFVVSNLIGLSRTFYQIDFSFYVLCRPAQAHSQTDSHGHNNEKVLLILKKWLKLCNKSNVCGEGCWRGRGTGVIICAIGSQTLHLSGVVWTAHYQQGPKHSNWLSGGYKEAVSLSPHPNRPPRKPLPLLCMPREVLVQAISSFPPCKRIIDRSGSGTAVFLNLRELPPLSSHILSSH